MHNELLPVKPASTLATVPPPPPLPRFVAEVDGAGGQTEFLIRPGGGEKKKFSASIGGIDIAEKCFVMP